ncbi:MAG: hypothetical protein QOI42_705 [Frankiaceae bacterium]|jgi:hypothetical protein|nr:hypothetical protein [Frankiaceae bacterium]
MADESSDGAQCDELRAVQRRLLDGYAAEVGDTAVTRSVTMAIAAVRFFGDQPQMRADLVERIARNELDLLREGRNERAWT